jgi:hypothetical protein
MEGMLLKHSPALLVSWQERRVVLENHQLRYFKKSDTKQWDELAGVLNFDLYKCTVSQFEKDNTIEIQVTGLDRKFLFKCDQAKSRVEWFQSIQSQIDSSVGVKKHLKAPKIKEFWRTEQITEKQFLRTADTFDILLFKCSNNGAALTRAYTGSDYGKQIIPNFFVDHVAMILRFDIPGEKKNDIFLVEAAGAGVHVKKWSTIRPAIGQFYKKIVVRHLNFERTEAQLTKLE